MKSSNDHEENNICIKCGMCCDGTLFSWGKINDGEKLDKDFEIIQHKGKDVFTQPCSYVNNCVCSIYNSSKIQRPLICGNYKCNLLKKYNKQEVSYENAIKIIEITKTTAAKLDKEITNSFPDIARESISNKIDILNEKHNKTTNQMEFRKNFGKILLNSVIFREILWKHFKNKVIKTMK